jgi:hypothetical protein
LCGSVVSFIFDTALDAYHVSEIKANAKLFLRLGATQNDQESIIDHVAREVTNHPLKKEEILSCKADPKVTGLINKIVAKCKKTKATIENKLDGGDLYETLYAKIGVQNAMDAIDVFLKYAKTLHTFAERESVIECLKHAVISESDWSITTHADVQVVSESTAQHLSISGDKHAFVYESEV